MESQWAHAYSSLDSSHTYDTEEVGLASQGSPKATKLFSRKPALDLCRKFREGKSRLDRSGQFAGFYSPTHNNPVGLDVSQQPEVRLFLLQSPKAQKQEPTRKIIQATPQSGITKATREPLKEIPTSKFELAEDNKWTPRQSTRYQGTRKELKQNVSSPQDSVRLDRQVATFQKDLALLKAENKTLKENNNSLKAENNRLASQTRQLEKKSKEIYDTLMETLRKSTDIQKQKDNSKAHLIALKEQLNTSERANRHLRQSIVKMEHDLQQANHALTEARRISTQAMAELDFVHHEASNERKLHQQNLKYAELKLLVLKKHRHDAEQLERSQSEVRRLTELNRKLRASVIEMKARLNELECRQREDLFSLSPESTPRDSE